MSTGQKTIANSKTLRKLFDAAKEARYEAFHQGRFTHQEADGRVALLADALLAAGYVVISRDSLGQPTEWSAKNDKVTVVCDQFSSTSLVRAARSEDEHRRALEDREAY